jgi:phosphatidylglycerophosphate synthase
MSSTQIAALRRSALRSILAAGALAVAGAVGARALLDLPPRSVVQTLLLAGVGAAALLAGLAQHSPHRQFGSANQVTLLRAVLVVLLAGAIGAAAPARLAWAATLVATVAALLDGLDGWLARRLHTASRYGARFDMETDALLVLVLSVLVLQLGKAGPWVLVAGLLRYGFVLAGLALPRLRRPLPPSRRRSAIAALQMILLIAALSPLLPRPTSDAAAGAAVLTLVASFALDVHWLWRL